MLKAQNISKEYTSERKKYYALYDVSMLLKNNCPYALVGESGSGKSTLAKILTAIEQPDQGEVTLDGQKITGLSRKKQRKIYKHIQLVLQDGKSSLNPRKTIYECIAEPVRNLTSISRQEEKDYIYKLVREVQLSEDLLLRKPHELSGGQQKRVVIARALSVSPEFIIFDEAVSGLDVTVQKKILDLIYGLREKNKSTYLFITHDIDVALYMAKDLFVMRDGRLIEEAHECYSYSDFKSDYAHRLVEALLPRSSIWYRNS